MQQFQILELFGILVVRVIHVKALCHLRRSGVSAVPVCGCGADALGHTALDEIAPDRLCPTHPHLLENKMQEIKYKGWLIKGKINCKEKIGARRRRRSRTREELRGGDQSPTRNAPNSNPLKSLG